MTKTLLLVLSGFLFFGCGDDDTRAGDGGQTADVSMEGDAGSMETDTGATDAGATDAGATDAGATDAGATDVGATDVGATDTGISADAGPLCLLNSDCPDDNLCSLVDGRDDVSYCIPGDRGTTPYGDACATSEQCVSGVCLDDYCTMACTGVDDCTSSNLPRCHPALGLCAPAAS